MTAIKIAACIITAVIWIHWLTAGQDNIIEGPPETPEVSSTP